MRDNSNIATLSLNINDGIANALKELHTCLPGIVETFNSDDQTMSVQPAVKRIFKTTDGDIEILTPVDLPLLINVPVIFQRAGGFAITFPIKKGDECLLLFCERSIDYWYKSGVVSEPGARRFHSLSDAVALPGLSSEPNKITSFNTTGLELRSDDGTTSILIKLGEIEVKGNVNITGSLNVSADIDGATITGATDVIAGSISGKTHTHIGSETAPMGPVVSTGMPQ